MSQSLTASFRTRPPLQPILADSTSAPGTSSARTDPVGLLPTGRLAVQTGRDCRKSHLQGVDLLGGVGLLVEEAELEPAGNTHES